MIRPARSIGSRTLALAAVVAGLQLATSSLGQSRHGLDLAGIDRSVAPGDDFFHYANGAWLKVTEIPPDRSSYGPGEQLTELTAERTAELVRSAVPRARGSRPRVVNEGAMVTARERTQP
jgi:putative endopeptidase